MNMSLGGINFVSQKFFKPNNLSNKLVQANLWQKSDKIEKGSVMRVLSNKFFDQQRA